MEQPSRGPLAGLRVVEIAGIGPGPFAAMLLADLGAEVLRVDRPGGTAFSYPGDVLNRGRRSIALDLKHPEAAEVVLRLVESADALVEGFRPGVAERLGFGPDVCLARKPALVYGRMTGWGQDGPLAQTAGHDITYIARTGALHAIGRAGGPPQVPLNLVGDFGGGGMLLAFGMCAALWEAQRSGKGQVVDAAIVDGTASLLAMPLSFMGLGAWRPERGVNLLDTGVPWYDVYATSDGEWVAVGALEPQFYAELIRVLDLADLPPRDDPANHAVIRERLTARFAERTRDEWAEVFDHTEACVAPVRSLAEAAADPQLAARQTLVELGGVVQPAPAPRFSRTPAALGAVAARPGEHTAAALRDWGLADADDLIARGVAVQG